MRCRALVQLAVNSWQLTVSSKDTALIIKTLILFELSSYLMPEALHFPQQSQGFSAV
jgi:hypothetical protein